MVVNIIRVEDNINLIDNKSYSIFTDNRDGTTSVQYNVHAVSDRIWIEEEFTFDVGLKYIYRMKLENDISLEGYVVEKGKDEQGYYILFLNNSAFMYLHNKEKRPYIPCGEIEIDLILSPDMIEGSDELIKKFHGRWPDFHEANIRIIEKSMKSMIIEFYGGFLSEVVVRLTITDIISENYDKNCIESFNDRWLTYVKFRRVGENMEVLLFDEYIVNRLPEEFDRLLYENPEFDIDTIEHLYIEEEYSNRGVIVCSNLKMVVTIDKNKKKQLEEEYKKFLESCQKNIFENE